MRDSMALFERAARMAGRLTAAPSTPSQGLHPFDERNVHSGLPSDVRRLFDNGHYAQATFEAYKYLETETRRHSGLDQIGFKLMMRAFAPEHPRIRLTGLSNTCEKDEQNGFQFIFAGSVLAIRDPRGHAVGMVDSPDKCLDHLVLASLLLRRLEEAGYK